MLFFLEDKLHNTNKIAQTNDKTNEGADDMQPQNINISQQNITPQNQQMPQIFQQETGMSEPPQVITTKDLAYIKDALSWELDIIKKFNHFAREAQDQQVKALIERVCQIHQRHYHMLLKHLNPMNSASKM